MSRAKEILDTIENTKHFTSHDILEQGCNARSPKHLKGRLWKAYTSNDDSIAQDIIDAFDRVDIQAAQKANKAKTKAKNIKSVRRYEESKPITTCTKCGDKTGSRYAKFCDACRPRKKRKNGTICVTCGISTGRKAAKFCDDCRPSKEKVLYEGDEKVDKYKGTIDPKFLTRGDTKHRLSTNFNM